MIFQFIGSLFLLIVSLSFLFERNDIKWLNWGYRHQLNEKALLKQRRFIKFIAFIGTSVSILLIVDVFI